jgi:hypothetical protein
MSVSLIPTPRAISKDPKSWNSRKGENTSGVPRATSYFHPFVVSTDGLIGKEAKTLLKKLSTPVAEEVVLGGVYVNARMSIAIVRATHICLEVPVSLQ